MGVGKSAVLAEASDLLARRRIDHAAVDVDALGLAYLPSGNATDDVMYRNLGSVCENYAALGVKRILLARAIESRSELEICQRAVQAKHTVVCRLTASMKTMDERVRVRESGPLQQGFVSRVAKLNAILDDARLEDFTIANDYGPLAEVAHEMLMKAGWISS